MKLFLVLCYCCELLLVSFGRNIAGPYLSPLLLLASSLAIGWLYLRISSKAELTHSGSATLLSPKVLLTIQLTVFAGITYYIFAKLKFIWWYQLMYGDKEHVPDMIPQIQILLRRFLNGEQPYYAIPFKEYNLYPTYLPLQWMPYVFSEWLHKDYRWIPTASVWLTAAWYFVYNRKLNTNLFGKILLPVLPLIVWGVFILNNNDIFVFAVEGLLAGYYLFVAESINKKSILPLAIAISCCLLSRYSIIFWVPLCVLLMYIYGSKKNAIIICASALLFFVVLYWFPFLRKDGSIFLQGYTYHTNAAYAEWQRDLDYGHGTAYLFNGLGFTSYIMTLISGTLHFKLIVYKNIHLALSMLTIACLIWFYIRHNAKYNLRAFLLFSFKIYLTVFYAFIQIPYLYLYLVPVIVSTSLMAAAFRVHSVNERRTLAN